MKVNIIGSGNVATHLAIELNKQISIKTVYSRNIENAKVLANKIDSIAINDLFKIDKSVDLNIVAVSDDSILEISKQLPTDIAIVHTSGSVSLDVFESFQRAGILYPLQTFSINSSLIVPDIPFLLEASTTGFENFLINFCSSFLSKKHHITTSKLRRDIHLAAVMSNNFITFLLSQSESILKTNNLSLNLLEPLINETIKKSFNIGPKAAQTGPAKRGDLSVMTQHLKAIENHKMKKVYQLLSELIQEQIT